MPAKIDLTDTQIKFTKQNYQKYGPKYCYDKIDTKMSFSTFVKKSKKMGLLNKPRLDYISKIFPVNEKSAYFLGFFFGDGYVISNNGSLDGINIEIQSEDANDIMNDLMFLPWRITTRTRRMSWKEVTRFNISNRPLAEHMFKLGFKSKHKKLPNLKIPDKYQHLFLRGILDADGHIKLKTVGSIIQISNSFEFNWQGITDIIYNNVKNITKFSIYRTKNKNEHSKSNLTLQHTQSIIKILDWIYKDNNNIGLNRKQHSYLQIKGKYGI